MASPWLDDPESHWSPASNEAEPAAEEPEPAEEADDFGDSGGDSGGEGDDSGEGGDEPEIEIEEGWGGDEEWGEEDPGDE